jgi:hypothetical protein
MPFNTAADISAFVNTIYEDALMVAREQTIMTSLVTVFNDRTGAAVRSNQVYGSATINAIGESDDLASQAFTPTQIATLTPGEFGGQFFLTDLRLETDPFGVRAEASLELGQAMGTKIDTDIAASLSSLTGGTVGAVATAMTWGHFFAALSRLRVQKAPMPYYAALHPYQWHSLGTAVVPAGTQTNAPEFQDAVMRAFWVAQAAGVQIFTTSNIALSGGTAATGGMFSRAALAFDNRRAPRLELQRDASRRGWELNMTSVYAQGVWRPQFGIQLTTNAAAPSS